MKTTILALAIIVGFTPFFAHAQYKEAVLERNGVVFYAETAPPAGAARVATATMCVADPTAIMKEILTAKEYKKWRKAYLKEQIKLMRQELKTL